MKKLINHKDDLDINKIIDQEIDKQFNMEPFELHEFSEEYKEKKKKIIESVDKNKQEGGVVNMGNNKIKKMWSRQAKIAAMALAGIALCTSSVYAINTLGQKTKHEVDVEDKGDYAVDLVVNKTDTNPVNEIKNYWILNKSYLPEGEMPVPEYENMKYNTGGIDGGDNEIFFSLYDISGESEELRVSKYAVLFSEDFEINGHKVVYTERDYCKEAYVYFEDSDCILWVYADNSIETDEFNKVIEGLSVTPGTKEEHDNQESLKNSIFNGTSDVSDTQYVCIKDLDKSKINILYDGDSFNEKKYNMDEGQEEVNIKYTIDKISLYDNFNDIGDGNLDYDTVCKNFMDENGNILPDHIKYIRQGDGINSVDTVLYEEDVNQKLVCVNFTVKNESDKEFESSCEIFNMTRMINSNGMYSIVDTLKEIDCDKVERSSDFINNSMVYYDFTDEMGNNTIGNLKAGEEKSFMVVFCVDECDLPNLYFNNNSYGLGQSYFYEKDTYEKQIPEVFNYVKVQK